MTIYEIIFIIIVLVWLFLVFKYKKRYKLSQQQKSFFNKQHKNILLSSSYKEQLIDMDKLYHKILQGAWYKWTFWEILKQKPSEISNLNKIWELHKVRNNLVHDFSTTSDKILKDNTVDYLTEIKKLINKF